MESRACFLHDKGAEDTMLLVAVGVQMIMEEHGAQLCICEETFDQRFIPAGARDIVPAVCRPVRYDSIKFYQMDMVF